MSDDLLLFSAIPICAVFIFIIGCGWDWYATDAYQKKEKYHDK